MWYLRIDLIDEFMNINKLTKTQFCKMCGITPYTFDKIMKNNANFGYTNIYKVAEAMKIDVLKLIYYKEKIVDNE